MAFSRAPIGCLGSWVAVADLTHESVTTLGAPLCAQFVDLGLAQRRVRGRRSCRSRRPRPPRMHRRADRCVAPRRHRWGQVGPGSAPVSASATCCSSRWRSTLRRACRASRCRSSITGISEPGLDGSSTPTAARLLAVAATIGANWSHRPAGHTPLPPPRLDQRSLLLARYSPAPNPAVFHDPRRRTGHIRGRIRAIGAAGPFALLTLR